MNILEDCKSWASSFYIWSNPNLYDLQFSKTLLLGSCGMIYWLIERVSQAGKPLDDPGSVRFYAILLTRVISSTNSLVLLE